MRLGELSEYITARIIFKGEEILFNYPKEHQIWLKQEILFLEYTNY